MKSIQECINEELQDITLYLQGERMDESLKDVFSYVKSKFQKVFTYLKGLVAKVGSYILPVEDGVIIPAITPLTAGQAMTDGMINKSTTAVILDKTAQKLTGCKMSAKDALALYGDGDSRSYWKRMLKECEELNPENFVNEVRLERQDAEAKYNVIVDDVKLKKIIKQYITNPRLPRLLIWGAPGIGKTAILNNVLSEMSGDLPGYQLIVKTLSNETPDNFTLPDYANTVDDTDFDALAKELGREPNKIVQLLRRSLGSRKAVDIPKTWLPVYKPTGDKELDTYLDEKCGKGLLFIDELSRATPQVLNVMLPLINEGTFNGYVLGSGWTIVTASNRMEDEFAGQTELGNALSNRFAQVYYEPTVQTWRKWADKQNFISPLLLQWLSLPESENMSGGKFYYMDPNEDLKDSYTKLMCTPRSWTNAMRDLACFSHTGTLEGFTIFDIDIDILKAALNRHVPASAVDAFVAFLDVISRIGNFDHAVYDIWQNGGKNFKLSKKDLNSVALPLAQLICTSHADRLPNDTEFENLCTWIVSQNSDQLASYVLDIFSTVYLGELPEPIRNGFYWIQEKRRRTHAVGGTDEVELRAYMTQYQPLMSKWHIDFAKLPDYSIGLTKLITKYGESFNNAVVGNHKDALR